MVVKEGTETYSKLTAGQSYELKISSGITCSTSDELKLSYTTIKSGDQEVPNWVYFNPKTGKIEIKTPKVSEDKTYEFSIETSVKGRSETYTKTFKLEVTSCKVKDCLECDKNDPDVCSKYSNRSSSKVFEEFASKKRALESDCYNDNCYYCYDTSENT